MTRGAYSILASAALIGAMPAAAQTAPADDDARLQAALEQAVAARNAAADALRKADEAIAILRRDLAERSKPASTQVAEAPAAPAARRNEDALICDAPGPENAIADRMLDLGDARKLKKEASKDENEAGSDRGINRFVYECLKLTRSADYENITNLTAQFTGTRGNDQIEAVVSRTARALKQGPDGTLYATYNRYSLGGFGRSGSANEAPLVDLTTSNFASGVGVILGFEWGRLRANTKDDLRKQIHAGLAQARLDCIADRAVQDPLEPGATTSRPYLVGNPVPLCEGEGLRDWMSATKKRKNKYWNDIVRPLWGYDGIAERFAGVQFRYAFQEVSFRPVIDPRTGQVIAPTLPPTQELSPEPFSVKLYGGFNRPIGDADDNVGSFGVTASLSYRREVDFIAGTSGRTICTPAMPGASFDLCNADQRLAAPYDSKGFVLGAALNLELNRVWYLPAISMQPRLTYAFDTNRLGYEIPLAFLTDKDGKVNSGIRYTCRLRGTTPEGFELKKQCNISLFVGTNFSLRDVP